MNKKDIQTLAENALHEACRHIQDAFAVQTGDTAGIFFCGENEKAIIEIFSKYIQVELMFKTYQNEDK